MWKRWSEDEDNIIRELYPNVEREVLQKRLPDCTWASIQTRANE